MIGQHRLHIPSTLRMPSLAAWCLMLWLLAALGTAHAAQPSPDWWSAIRRDDVSAVQTMLLRGTDPAALNEIGNPALTQAAREQSWKVFDLLRIARGVEIDQPNAYDETPLMYVCILGQTERARELIDAGAQVNRLGWTPLHYAASKARIETAQLLIQRGAIVNAPGPDGTTPLMMAALSGKEPMVRLLLEHGADATMFNAKHETAADWAARGKHTALADKLQALSREVALRRQWGGDKAAVPAPQPPAGAASKAEDQSSFSRYFDLERFEDTPAGQ
ncbi:ankyrin repeat domain-containing protein [Castellaniella sp. S9]|uniref:ankyrin repeat domain-containing protein n=1 Tax=Castellaniella sp. S9 TaxID=2993652 RepID=UPI0022B55505|nr:ankyrin repeat domain-containing protein [Castellaniella sp. S9]